MLLIEFLEGWESRTNFARSQNRQDDHSVNNRAKQSQKSTLQLTEEQNETKPISPITKRIQVYRDTERGGRNAVKNKLQRQRILAQIHRKWMNGKLQEDAEKLQKASGKMNMRAIWEYTKNMRGDNKSRHRPLKKENGERANNLKEEMQRWQNWIRQTSNKTQKTLYQE